MNITSTIDLIDCLAILFGLLSCFAIMLAHKWGWIEWYEVHRKLWMPLRCEFCLSFWLCLFFFEGYAIFTQSWQLIHLLSIPCGTVISWLALSIIEKSN